MPPRVVDEQYVWQIAALTQHQVEDEDLAEYEDRPTPTPEQMRERVRAYAARRGDERLLSRLDGDG